MKRREFIKASLTALGAAWLGRLAPAAEAADAKPIPRRPFKDDVRLSVIGYGGMLAVDRTQAHTDALVAEAVERGVNYFDTAPTYGNGEAEEKMGPALSPYRDRIFLACKTTCRDAAGAREELDRSLRRLRTDFFDLYQFHGVSALEDVDKIFAKGGAAETLERARREGKVRYLGFSAHSEAAALALMDRFAFDSMLFPVNFVCYAQGGFGPRALAKAREKGVARLGMKGLACTPWARGEERRFPKCWYRPIEDRALAAQSLAFSLGEDIVSMLPPGDDHFFRLALDLASDCPSLSPGERQALLDESKGIRPLFTSDVPGD